MELVTPKVFLVGAPELNIQGMEDFLEHVGVSSWKTNAPSAGEEIVEVMGRLCYRSFTPGLNPNVTKVREGNDTYLDNIIDSRHGSVTEHAMVNFIFADVSRVFTHELCRHRVGTAISQESLRYVRLEELKVWFPPCIADDPVAFEIAKRAFEHSEKCLAALTSHWQLDTLPFHKKKELTSAMRRLAPDGLATTIGWSANFRTLRHVIEMRTSPSSEVEIRKVFSDVAKICIEHFPNVFGDYVATLVDGYEHYQTNNPKI